MALYLRFQKGSCKGRDVTHFLRYLLQQLRGPIILLWDRNPIHKEKSVQRFVERHRRLQTEFFPGYAPELNPAEYVWAQTDSALANSSPEDLIELRYMLRQSKRRLKNSQQLLWSCIYASDLPWA